MTLVYDVIEKHGWLQQALTQEATRAIERDGCSDQARIQEFSSGGVQLSENFDKQNRKKGGGQKTVGCDA